MTFTGHLHGATFTARAFDTFTTVDMADDTGNRVCVFLTTDESCDDLIRAALAVKDLRRGMEHAAAMAPLPDRGRYDAPSAAAVAEGLPVLDDEGGEDALDPAPEACSNPPEESCADAGCPVHGWDAAPSKDVSTISEIPVIADAMAAKALAELRAETGTESGDDYRDDAEIDARDAYPDRFRELLTEENNRREEVTDA